MSELRKGEGGRKGARVGRSPCREGKSRLDGMSYKCTGLHKDHATTKLGFFNRPSCEASSDLALSRPYMHLLHACFEFALILALWLACTSDRSARRFPCCLRKKTRLLPLLPL